MTEAQRHQAILDLLQQKRHMTVTGLIDAFDISPATARRDINKLNDTGNCGKFAMALRLSRKKEASGRQ